MNLVKRFFNYLNKKDTSLMSNFMALSEAQSKRPPSGTLSLLEDRIDMLLHTIKINEDTHMTTEFSIGVNQDSTESPDIYQKAVTEIVKDVRGELDTISGMLTALEFIVTKRK